MRSILENKVAFAVIVIAFLFASGAVIATGSYAPVSGHSLLPPDSLYIAHGPTMPPDPWEGTGNYTLVAHGPTMPPDPWEGTGNVA